MNEQQQVALRVCDVAIRCIDGLYSLNDLHAAAGGDKKHQPANFMRLDTTQGLIEELNSSDSRSFKSIAGRNGGTYVCKELVYAYAMWISAKFHLQVIRAYDAPVAKQLNLFLLSAIDERGKHVVIASDCCSRRTHSVSIGLTQGNPAHGFSESETFRQPTSSPREGSATTQE